MSSVPESLWLPDGMVHAWSYEIVTMSQNVILITGAAGFLGSAITLALSREHAVVAVDAREPSEALRRAAPGVSWQRLDIADSASVTALFRSIKGDHGRLDFLIHLAAFYHFGRTWLPEYERTNVRGTANLLRAAKDASAQRVIFASSIAAMEPPRPGEMLTERTPTSSYIPYARSKRLGEEMLAEEADALPGIVLRVAGAFSDWCELPPLYSLIKRWSGRGPSSRLVPGRGNSGFPYIHRDDVVRSVMRCIECHATLAPFEVLLASPSGTVSHGEVFSAVRLAGRVASRRPPPAPILIPRAWRDSVFPCEPRSVGWRKRATTSSRGCSTSSTVPGLPTPATPRLAWPGAARRAWGSSTACRRFSSASGRIGARGSFATGAATKDAMTTLP